MVVGDSGGSLFIIDANVNKTTFYWNSGYESISSIDISENGDSVAYFSERSSGFQIFSLFQSKLLTKNPILTRLAVLFLRNLASI